MAERELFQIGEVTRMYHLSVGTLRHYERIDLLAPERTDPATDYRYYSVRQLEQDQKVPLSYIGKVGVGIPVHNGGHVLGECVGNASSDGMKLK